MYDKLKLLYPRMRGTPDISGYLDKAKEQTDLKTGEVCIFGSLDGLKVSIYTGGYSIIGSLAKYLYPSNVYPLDRHSTVQAIEKLSDALHIDMKEAKVTGLEFGTQFVMRKPVDEYLKNSLQSYTLNQYAAVVLGCTHFNYFKQSFRKIFPGEIHFVDGNEGTLRQLKRVLPEQTTPGEPSKVTYYFSGEPADDEGMKKIQACMTQLDKVYEIK